ncbi:hypothetical protein Daesc_009420 [Daldinia eschscholtzii]|uniref:Uncharacterized protein n=1 Tax=Daldinia eschscholtzii TaxID=292717 RepID=A0AAX6M9M1_9PEZI
MSNAKKVGLSAVFAVGIVIHRQLVALWAIAESTCGTLIFCALVIPKLFQSLRIEWDSTVSSWAGSPMHCIRCSTRKNENRWTPKRFVADPREYRHINESNSIALSGGDSARPTNQQYGIVCTTDIIVTESRDDGFLRDQPGKRNSWLSSVQDNRV